MFHKSKDLRRMARAIHRGQKDLQLFKVDDPRNRKGRRWRLSHQLAGILVGLLAGCKSLKETEELTATMGKSLRRMVGIRRRLPDTTARQSLCKVNWESLRGCLHRLIRKAIKRKVFRIPVVLPFHMVAMDGKGTALPAWDDEFAQKHEHEDKAPYGLLRTITSVLTTGRGKPCIDVLPIPAKTNEVGIFEQAFLQLLGTYGRLFRLVSYDAGASSEHNASLVVKHNKDYLFRLNDERRHMQVLAQECLATKEFVYEQEDVRSNNESVTRKIRLFKLNEANLPKLPRKSCVWSHAKVFVEVRSFTYKNGECIGELSRYYVSSMSADVLTPKQWLFAVVRHWAVETCHQQLDVALLEDKRPGIVADPKGTLALIVLRRIAFTLLTLFRSVTLRSEERRNMPWQTILRWVRRTAESTAVLNFDQGYAAALR